MPAHSPAPGFLALPIAPPCSEAGVRNLKKQLEKIYRKAALQLVRKGVAPAAPAQPAAQQAQQAHAEPAAASEEPAAAAEQQQGEQQRAGRGEGGEHAAPGADHPGSRVAQLAAHAEGAAATAVAEPLIVIDRADLKEYVGQPPYPADKIYADGTPVGESACRGTPVPVFVCHWRSTRGPASPRRSCLSGSREAGGARGHMGLSPPRSRGSCAPCCALPRRTPLAPRVRIPTFAAPHPCRCARVPLLPSCVPHCLPRPRPCAGVVMGLAWTALGGSTLYVEAASVERGEGKGSLKATGKPGSMRGAFHSCVAPLPPKPLA